MGVTGRWWSGLLLMGTRWHWWVLIGIDNFSDCKRNGVHIPAVNGEEIVLMDVNGNMVLLGE